MGQRVQQAVLLASAARTATPTIDAREVVTSLGRTSHVEVVLDLTAFATAASLTLKIQEYVEGKADYVDVVAAAALTATGQKRLIWGPTVPTSANASATGIATKYKVVVTHGNANSHTYSVTVKEQIEL